MSLGKSICHTKPTKAPSLWLQGSTCLTDQKTVSKFRSNSHWVTYKLCDVNQLHHPSKFRTVFVELLWCLNQIVILIRWRWWWFSCSVMSTSLWPLGLWPARLLCPWGFPRQEYWSGLPFLFQGIFPAQGSNLSLPDCRQTPPTELQGKPLCPSESLAKRSKEQVMAVRGVAGRRGGRGIRSSMAASAKAGAEGGGPAAWREEQGGAGRGGGREDTGAGAQASGWPGARCFLTPVLFQEPEFQAQTFYALDMWSTASPITSTCLRSSFLIPVLSAPLGGCDAGWKWWEEVHCPRPTMHFLS